MISARRSILLDTQHPDGLEKIRELEAQGRPARLEIEEPPVTPPRFVTELRVSRSNNSDNYVAETFVTGVTNKNATSRELA